MAPDRGVDKKALSRSWKVLNPPLSPWLSDAMASMNFSQMTPVQASTIPLFMTHKDVVVEAVTGSGKTLAFLIPVIEKILRLEEVPKKHHVNAIIISPTRELAAQIHSVLLSILALHEPSSVNPITTTGSDGAQVSISQSGTIEQNSTSGRAIIPQLLLGGSSTAAQDLSKFLKTSPNILISTPGRLLEILSSPYVHCPQSSFEMLVLDEADRLLDLGFKDDLTKILALLPKQRRTGLFSASVSEAVDQIIRVGLRNPVRVAVRVKGANGVQDKKTPASLKMTYLVTKASEKIPALAQILQKLDPTPLRTIVYLSTCAAVDYFQSLLPTILPPGMTLVPLHGKHPSNVRQKNFIRFTNSASPAVLLTTDVAARGLDIPEVDLVIQIDPPSDPKAFVHRCGRAGRAGRRGLSIIFLQPGSEEEYAAFLEIRKTPIELLKQPMIEVGPEAALSTAKSLQQLVSQDRGLHEKAQKAFVSWVRSYSKHQTSSIFKISELDWADLALGWGLLKFPKMPELRDYDKSLFDTPVIDWDSYAYKDRQREKQRQAELKEAPESAAQRLSKKDDKKRKGTSVAWSQKIEHKESKAVKRSKKDAKKEFERKSKLTDAERDEEAETARMLEKVREQERLNMVNDDQAFEGFD